MSNNTPIVNRELLGVLRAYRRELDSDTVRQLAEHIRPVIRKDGRLRFMAPVDPINVSFMQQPEFTEQVLEPNDLVKLVSIYTLHLKGLFRPLTAEVLAMIPPHLLGKVVAFETIGPESKDDMRRQTDAAVEGFCVAVTHLYM